VNLIGEHTDYNHGYVLPAALDRDVLLLARPRTDGRVRLHNMEPDFPSRAFALSTQIPPAPPGDWANYAQGAAQEMARRLGPEAPGFDGLVSSQSPYGVPRGAGLSSSSALTVAVAVTLAHLAGWAWEGNQMAQICSDGEWYVGTRGGIMDQFIALLGQRDHALFLDCRPDGEGRFQTQAIPLPQEYRLLVVESGVHHSNTRNEFNARVAACRAGVALLGRSLPGITHLRDVEGVDWADLEPELPTAISVDELIQASHHLGDLPNVPGDLPLRVRACCRHVWHENRRVLAAVDALQVGDVTALGYLLAAAHASARDDYRISVPEIEALVQAAGEVDGCAGARLTGAGWGGCIIALVHQDVVTDFTRHVTARYQSTTGRVPTLFPCQASPGAGWVGEG
jgi:galactokinase